MSVQIPAKRYDSAEACLAAYFDCEVSELPNVEGYFEMLWANGKKESWTAQRAMADIKDGTHWAWVENKQTIHYWISEKAEMWQIVKMFAHELGHMQRPFHRSLKEEQKADRYANVAAAAYDIAVQAMDEITGS